MIHVKCCYKIDMENQPEMAHQHAANQEPQDPLFNHALAQQIYREEEIRVAQGDLTTLAASQQDESELQGEPLTYRQCRQLCPNSFVRNSLFRISGAMLKE